MFPTLQVIRDMLADMGSPGSLPKDDKDVIDMMSVLQELTFSSAERRGARPDMFCPDMFCPGMFCPDLFVSS